MKTSERAPLGETLFGISGLVLIASMAFLPGCGGGGSSAPASVTVAATGRAAFVVTWPARTTTRLIPLAANSIRVDILRNNGVVQSQIIARPDAGGSAVLMFSNLPVDTLTARATAYPNADGTGTAQASGSVPVTIKSGQLVDFSLTMDSTIDHLEVAPTGPTLAHGQSATLTATARDATGKVVLLTPTTLQWASSNPAVASVDADGTVHGLAVGNATLTVTEQESGKSVATTVAVSAAAPSPSPSPSPDPTPTPDPFAGTHEYLTIDPDNLPNYANPVYPVHYDNNIRSQDNTPADNAVTNRGATLGRVLFFDKRLSINDTVACASCHQQADGMTDSRRFSPGFSGTMFTSAHAMRLGNVRFYTGRSMFWDKRAASVEAQATQPIQNPIEMGFDADHGGFAAVVTKMQALPYYPELFRWAFGDATITEDRVQKALAQYERSMVSVNSRFDTAFAQVYDPAAPGAGVGQPLPGFTAQEERGKQLFLRPPGQGGAGCAGCHSVPTFALAANSRSNGLDAGEKRIFKSPSLKNIGRTGPYMHDGRFATLEQVVDHYISGVQNGPALDNRLKNPQGQPQRLPLTTDDRDALVAFLKTLDDTTLTSDPKFTDPFRK